MIKVITFNDINICTESYGDKNNPALLLIMGATCSMIWWEASFCDMMADKGFYVIRYDNRDTGKSTSYPPGEPKYTFEELSDDAIQILDAYGIETAIIMGMSMGGMLTQMIAVRHPERIKGIVLLSTMYFAEGAESLPYSSDEVNNFFETFTHQKLETLDAIVEHAVKQWQVTTKSRRPHDENHIRKMNRRDIERAACFESRINHSYAQVTGDELGKIFEITAPTLVIHGTDDVVIPYAHGEMLAKKIPNAILHTMDGAGHELHPLDYEGVANSIVNRFL